tara:strand:+ start:45484 stop:47358 length:1875 start_codon:yes stop_codon:yes gene_type:complete
MLQNIRSNAQGTAAKVIVGLIVISFSLFGIESILVGGSGSSVAEVNGEEITPQELQQAVNTQKRRLISIMGDNIDPMLLDDQRLSAQAMESLVNRKLLMQSAQELDLTISEGQVGSLIAGMEQFQIDGKFSPEVYKSVLSSAGYTPGYFKQILRDDLVISQLQNGLVASEFATPAELTTNARISAEQRDLRYLTIPLQNYLDGISVSDAEIEQYYAANADDFKTVETLDLDYIALEAADFIEPVEESALLEAYNLEIQNGQYQTQSRVSHILFEEGSDKGAIEERLASAQEQLDAGSDFAEIARAMSDDVGSADTGGDLGYSSGDVFPPEMEEAIANLDLNQVSEPVETDAGTHLILVTERTEGKAPELDEIRDRLSETLQLEAARVALLRTVEELKDLSFNADDLSAPAKELGLEVERANDISRSHTEGLFATPVVLAAAFSDDVIEAGHNSEVIEYEAGKFVVLHAHQHRLPQVKPLSDVREQIAAQLTEDAARKAVAAEALQLVQALREGGDIEQLANENGYEWQVELGADRRSASVPQAIIQRAFALQAPNSGEKVVDYAMSVLGDAQVFEIVRVTPGSFESMDIAARQRLQQQLGGEYSNLIDTEFRDALRSNADITVL